MTLLSETLTPERSCIPLKATTKVGLIEELLDILVASGDLVDREAALQAVLRREETRSTAVGSGLALPHGKTDAVKNLVMAMGRTAQPVDFNSTDDEPVSLVVLLLSPKGRTGPHIRALAQVSQLIGVDAFRRRLLAARTPNDVHELFRRRRARIAS